MTLLIIYSLVDLQIHRRVRPTSAETTSKFALETELRADYVICQCPSQYPR